MSISSKVIQWTLVAAAFSACHKSNSGGGSGSEGPLPGTGCIQGTLVDGIKSAPVALPAAQGSSVGLFVLVRDQMLAASSTADATTPQLAGDYNLCDVPLDQDYPLFAWVPGYQPFESVAHIYSTTSSRSPSAQQDILKPYPVELVNIRLYPQNQQVKDLTFVITHNGVPLQGANIALQATGTNFLDPSGDTYLTPVNIRQAALTATSGADGTAVFKAADLVLGAHYTYTVTPPNGGQDQTAVAANTFILGLRDNNNKTSPYQVNVDLAHAQEDLAVISKSTDDADPDPTGKIVLYFNRAVELVPGSADNVTATLSGNVTAQIADNTPGNNAPEQVTIVISGNTVTLKPVYKTNPDTDPTKEIDLSVAYSGVELRPKDVPGTLNTVTISETVRYYR